MRSQDGNQRVQGRWEFTIPDLFPRVVLTGYYTGASPEAGIRSRVVCATSDKSQAGVGNTGYTVPGTFPSGSVTVLKADYYDTYDFLEKYPDEKVELSYTPRTGYGERFMGYPVGTSGIIQLSMTPHAGMLTGSYAALLSTSGVSASSAIVSAFYYDDKDRIVQQLATNHLGGYEKE